MLNKGLVFWKHKARHSLVDRFNFIETGRTKLIKANKKICCF